MAPKRPTRRRTSVKRSAARKPKVQKLLIAAVIGSACIDKRFRQELFYAPDPVAWISERIKGRAWKLTPLEKRVLSRLMQPAYKRRLMVSCEKLQRVVRASTSSMSLKFPWCTYPCAL